ncbi:cytochrome c [Rhodoplanes sp. Z2-YC6860]|uniref:cytochrome c n=1 Tax=Rhodoplanes sp. Z2-YC6860 TaxID=674703 RepID=UPI001F42B2A1|nr:cytochrome c [Rhodoplanes sp. Z2-YC6860]
MLGASLTVLVVAGSGRSLANDPQEFSQIERGRYLAVASDCASCHTVPESKKPFAGGRPIETPFGNIVAPNITPDPETGIGVWTADAFDNALRKGRGRTGSHLYPAMPYNAYTKMSRRDVDDIFAYLKTVEPVRNKVESNTLPFPFNIRAAMGVWNALYFKEGEFKPNPEKSPEWNRGAFLVEGPGHCGACHTPKSFLGGDKTSQHLQGSQLQGWFAPNITNDPNGGLAKWSTDDLVVYLSSGHNRITAATGPMAEEVELSSSKMQEGDLHAIATYLQSVGGKAEAAKPIAATDPAMVAGDAIYRDQCSACHGLDGKGVPKLFPSLVDSGVSGPSDPTTAVRIILRGARSIGTKREPTAPGMPSYGTQLDDAQVAAVATYIRNAWGRSGPAVPPSTVKDVRADTAMRPD